MPGAAGKARGGTRPSAPGVACFDDGLVVVDWRRVIVELSSANDSRRIV